MLEKEVKILEIDKEKLIKKLNELWAEKTFEWDIHDIYYDFCSWTKQKMQENDRLFRIRKRWDKYLYTIKRKRMKADVWWEDWVKIADEWEWYVTDIKWFETVLEKYWMKKVREKKKFRTSFSLPWFEFDIDEYEWIPHLLEIEAHTKEEIDDMIIKLWLEKHVIKSFGSRWLFEYYWKDYLYL